MFQNDDIAGSLRASFSRTAAGNDRAVIWPTPLTAPRIVFGLTLAHGCSAGLADRCGESFTGGKG